MRRFPPQKHPSVARTSTVDSCGCAMGARFLGVALVVSIGYFAWRWPEYSLGRAGIRTLAFAFAGAILGKVVGIVTYRFRARLLRG